MMDDETFEDCVSRKRSGGVPLEAFVSREVWLGGLGESRGHEPFVAIGPANWEGEEELTFFANRAEIEAFIDMLKEVSRNAFSDEKPRARQGAAGDRFPRTKRRDHPSK